MVITIFVNCNNRIGCFSDTIVGNAIEKRK